MANRQSLLSSRDRAGRCTEAGLLCLLKEHESYGYELIEKLRKFEFEGDRVDISVVYRNLRSMEKNGLIVSKWAESAQGPQKRMYSLTALGEKALDGWIRFLKGRRMQITAVIDKYESMH